MTAADVALIADPRTPDGSRPLMLGRPVDFLEPRVATEPLDCFIASHARRHNIPVHPDCRQRIEPAEHYLRQLHRDVRDAPTGVTWAYCAPCAVREAAWWHVQEETTP